MHDLTIVSILLSVAVISATLTYFFSERLKEIRHDYKGRFLHVYQRILRLENFLERKLKFDKSDDLPDIGNKDK